MKLCTLHSTVGLKIFKTITSEMFVVWPCLIRGISRVPKFDRDEYLVPVSIIGSYRAYIKLRSLKGARTPEVQTPSLMPTLN